ncbi:hypothetical protein OC25_26575, partial [Pedobacter kyungheensis]
MIRHFRAGGNHEVLSEANLNALAIYALCTGFLPLTAAAGSYFFLDEKVTKNQGLDLMLDKLVETLLATAARNEEKS